MELLNFDKSTLKYYNDDKKTKMIDQFQQIEKQLEEYFKKSNLCIIKLHKCDNLDDFIKYNSKYNNNKKTIIINLLPLMKEKIAEKIIKSKYELFHTNIYIAYNGKYISSKEKKINESFLNLCNDILKTEEYECNICMETIINNLLVQCLKCKYTVCSKCKYKMKLKCPICDR
jgi:hypothetical protein